MALLKTYPQEALGHIKPVQKKQVHPARTRSLRKSLWLEGSSLPNLGMASNSPIRHTEPISAKQLAINLPKRRNWSKPSRLPSLSISKWNKA